MVPSNYFTPEDETAPPYLADWATATGIRPRSPDHIAQRAIDLGKPFEDYWNGARVIRPKLLDNKIMLATLVNQQLGTLLSNYLGKKVAVAISPKNEIFMLQALVGSGVEYVQRELAHYLPRIDQIPPTGKEYNPERAEKLKKQLLSYIAKALV